MVSPQTERTPATQNRINKKAITETRPQAAVYRSGIVSDVGKGIQDAAASGKLET